MGEHGHTIQLDNVELRDSMNPIPNSNDITASKEGLINDVDSDGIFLSRLLITVRTNLVNTSKRNSRLLWLLFKIVIYIALLAYLIAVIWHWYNNGKKSLDWCTGNGMIVILYTILVWILFYYKFLKPFIFAYIKQNCTKCISSKAGKYIFRLSKTIAMVLIICGITIFLILDTAKSRIRLVSAGGFFVFFFLGFLFSKHPSKVRWNTVLTGIILQILFGLLVIRWHVGRAIFMCIGNRVETFLQFGYKGAAFIYSEYLVSELQVFAFQSLSVIYFLSTVIEICFYFGWLQEVCFKLGWFLQTIMGTTIVESVNAVTSVFLGLSEAPLLYKPYIKDLTPSEVHAVMAGGFSTAAGSVFAAYAALGVNPAYIITASVMSAPSALCFAKVLYPENQKSRTSVKTIVPYKSEAQNVVDAACKGALSATNLVLAVIATVLACVSFMAFIDSTLVWFATLIGYDYFSFEYLVGKILSPIPYIMGVTPDECDYVARLIGIKITVNEFVAYKELGKYKKAHLLSPRSEAMATFALCSFANPGGLASFIALLVSLSPSQKQVVTNVAIRALVSGITTGLLTATIAGTLMPEDGFGECETCFTTMTTLINSTTMNPLT